MKKLLIFVLFVGFPLNGMNSRHELSRSASPVVKMFKSNHPYILHNMSEKLVEDALGNQYAVWHGDHSTFISLEGVKKIFSGIQTSNGEIFKTNEFFTKEGEKIVVHNIEEFNLVSQESVQSMESSLDSSLDDSKFRTHPLHTIKEVVVQDGMGNRYKLRHSEIGNALVTNLKTKQVFSGKKCPRSPIERTNEFFAEDGARYVVYNLKKVVLNRD